jgi:cytochrome c553
VIRVLGALVMLAAHAVAAAPQWAVDPAEPGPDLPPVGRSVFDAVAADGVPFPFEALLQKIEGRIGCAKRERCMHGVLIPLGRSLQRTAAAPDFFAHPRAVVAVTGAGRGPLYARDRLFVGYQETSGLLEVISFNEAAGRFEFQIVRDYRAGGTPAVVYAARTVCIACHQNHAPIFSRPVWDETNANPAVADRLAQTAARHHGIDVRRGVDFPNAIDDATERANLLAVTRRIWTDACDDACRDGAVRAAQRYVATRGRDLDEGAWRDALVRGFANAWPDGLAVPNPDLPNRDPFLHAAGREGLPAAHVAAAFEPLAPRPPLEVWRADDSTLPRRFVAGLVEDRWLLDPGCCATPARLPPPMADRAPLQAAPDDAVPFIAACAACHATPETSPPNFLWGDAARVERQLRHCAPRIHARLGMWQATADARAKTPMPPPAASRDGAPWTQPSAPEGLRRLRDQAANWVRAETGRSPEPGPIPAEQYEYLRPCLAPVAGRLQ